MAAFDFGASSLTIKSFSLRSVGPQSSILQPLHGLGTRKNSQFNGLVFSHRPRNTIIGCRSSVSETIASLEDKSKQTESTDAISPLILSANEVESLLTELCHTTSITEFELKLGGFRLYVSRDLAEQEEPPALAPATAHTVVETPASNNSVSSTSLALVRSNSSSAGVQTLLDKATDEGLALLQSPRVGFFRRSRTIKGKRAPPSCKEKDTVKEGQVLCYIEQLGGEIPIESDVAGEVVKILKKDGDPVGYGDALIALLPSFPGIKKL